MKKTKSSSIIIILIVLGASQLVPAAYQVGDIVADFTLPIHHLGPNTSLYDYTGHIIVLDFFAYWCGPCRTASSELEPYIQQYYNDMGGNPAGIPVKLISINIDCSRPSETDAYIAQYGLESVLDDCSYTVFNAYGSGSIPQFAIINGVAGANYNQWKLLNNQLGYSSGQYTSFRAVIDSVQGPVGGSLQTILIPSEAVSDGARWNVNGGPWQNSGSMVNNLSPGTHTVNYKTIEGVWMTPPSEQVMIQIGQTTQLTQTYRKVDINKDNRVNMLDFVLFANRWQSAGTYEEDLDYDGVVLLGDLLLFTENWLWVADPQSADINGDGCVDMLDFSLFASKWQYAGSCREDLDWDAVVGFGDLVHFLESWLEGAYINVEVDGFETGDLYANDWQHSGSAYWTVTMGEAYEGAHSAKSGTITHNQISELEITLDCTGFNSISFARKVSSESNWDYLKFYIDATQVSKWSGIQNWTTQNYSITSGTHTFKWSYEKDGSISTGSDCAWIDAIVLSNE